MQPDSQEKFSKVQNEFIGVDLNVEVRPEYKKMLNNLLLISARDNAIFASNRNRNIDLSRIVSERDLQKVFRGETFKVEITDTNNAELIELLHDQNDQESFLMVADENGMFVSLADRQLLKNDFSAEKANLIHKIQKQQNKKIAKWKRFKNNYLDLQTQVNSWPLYVGTMFVKVKTYKASLYAPLILKKVQISISNKNKITLESIDGGIDLNEKLLFLLQNEYRFNLPKMNENARFSFFEVVSEYQQSLGTIIKNTVSFPTKWVRYTKAQVKNPVLEFAPGLVLTICSPSGGNLRNKLIDLLKSPDDMEAILDFDDLKNVKAQVSKAIERGQGIYRITPTDLSQEEAILGALKDSSIIWGPPGTGKSQTIANIIANLLFLEKRVIVTSQKKAALDVLQKRLGSLSKFVFFGLTDKNVKKEEFYKPFNELSEIISSEVYGWEKRIKEKNYFTSNERAYHNQKKFLQKEDISAIYYCYSAKDNYPDFWNNLSEKHSWVKNNLPLINKLVSAKEMKAFLKLNNIQKKGFLFKRYPRNIKTLIALYNQVCADCEFLDNFSKIKSSKNLKEFTTYLQNEEKYCAEKRFFLSDEQFLERYLSWRIKERIKNLYFSEEYRKKVRSFLRNARSNFRIPYKFVSIHKEIINKVFNVFVSTPQTLANVLNLNEKYDYSVFDEASQLHLEKAIPFMGISSCAVIAGDPKQMRPTNFFAIRDTTEILEESEENVASLLDYAYNKGMKGTREYMLNKNYRANSSQLISFSAREFYEKNLNVVDNFAYNIEKPIEVVNVDGVWSQQINDKEATAVLNRCLKELENFKQIILLTLNSNQKQFIENIIYNEKKYEPIIEAIKNGNVYLRNLENIQGDEANLVLVSVAYDKNASLGSTYVARPEGKNALNVAITRAKDKMVVFKSIYAEEIIANVKNDSVRVFKNWIQFLDLPADKRKTYSLESDEKLESFDSFFEVNVYEYLKNKFHSFKRCYLTTQYEVGSYRIDIAFLNSKTHKFVYGVEVDGYKYHSGYEKMSQDVERQSFLQAKGYPIYRITELTWKINKFGVLQEITSLVNQTMGN